MMQWTTVFQVGATLIASGALGGGISAVLNRRKVHADTTVSLSDAAMRQLSELREDFEKQRTEIRQLRQAMYVHQRWDSQMITRLEKAGVSDIPEPPELFI